MVAHLFSSWEIMPQAIMVCTGDVHVGRTVCRTKLLRKLDQTKRTSSFLPSARAYLSKEFMEGQRPRESPLSIRATADWLVPIR